VSRPRRRHKAMNDGTELRRLDTLPFCTSLAATAGTVWPSVTALLLCLAEWHAKPKFPRAEVAVPVTVASSWTTHARKEGGIANSLHATVSVSQFFQNHFLAIRCEGQFSTTPGGFVLRAVFACWMGVIGWVGFGVGRIEKGTAWRIPPVMIIENHCADSTRRAQRFYSCKNRPTFPRTLSRKRASSSIFKKVPGIVFLETKSRLLALYFRTVLIVQVVFEGYS